MLITTRAFLRAVLPTEGVYCGFLLPEKKHIWFDDTDALADAMLRADEAGGHVYHACASYKGAGKRTKSNVHRVRALWIDVDAGPGKPYTDALDAYRALETFRARVDLPKPIVVGSGLGLHIYWPLADDLSVDAWEPLARALKQACSANAFHAGAERTADCASILRPPGTHHRKGEAILVECSNLVNGYELERFGGLDVGSGGTTPRTAPASTTLERQPRRNLAAEGAHVADFAPSDGERVAEHCLQLKTFRETGGNISEPEWKACLNVLAFSRDGATLVHEWSAGHPNYNEAETTDKFERGKQLSGPTTCEWFSSLNSLCSKCLYHGTIKSPIELGRATASKFAPEQVKAGIEFAEKRDPRCVDIADFTYHAGALVWQEEAQDKVAVQTKVTQYPVFVSSMNRGENRVDQHYLVLKHKPPHEDWRTVELPLRILFSSSGIADVMGKGVIVHEADLFRKFIRLSLDMLQAKGKAMIQFEQFGWKEDDSAFLIGRKLYTSSKVHEVEGSAEVVKRARAMGPTSKGSLAGWKAAADQLFGPGVEGQGFALLASFAAPLMRFHSSDEGGAVVSVYSRESGVGKSTALAGAASVWGQLQGMQILDPDTKVSKGITLGVMGSLPVIFDELNHRDPESVREFVQVFTTGRDKQRASQAGELIHTANTWQTLLITGSNLSLIDTLKSTRSGDAMSMRVIEFNLKMPGTIKHSQGDQLKEQLYFHAGHAGDAFMRALIQPETLEYVRRALPKIRQDITEKHRFNSEHRFWVRTLASISVASVIVRHLGLISFSADRIMEWAIESLTNRKTLAMGEMYEGSHMLSLFLSQHIGATLGVPGPFNPRTKSVPFLTPQRDLVVRMETDGNRILIEKSTLRQWMSKQGVAWSDLIAELEHKRILVDAQKLVTLGAGTIYARGQSPCLIIDGNAPAMSGVLAEVQQVSNERVRSQ